MTDEHDADLGYVSLSAALLDLLDQHGLETFAAAGGDAVAGWWAEEQGARRGDGKFGLVFDRLTDERAARRASDNLPPDLPPGFV
jgi:hypothetical protein